MSIQRLHVGPRLSEVAIHNGVVYLAGQVAEDSSLDITGQTQQVLAAIDRLLAEAGSDKTLVLQANKQALTAVRSLFVAHNHGQRLGIPAQRLYHQLGVVTFRASFQHLNRQR